MIAVKYHRGLELPGQGLFLDPWDPKPFAFVSHAHSDHIANHEAIIASHRTAQLMDARLPGKRTAYLLPFREPAEVRGLRVTLYEAGHIFGSAQLYMESDEGSILYTGDFKLRPSLSAEPTTWRNAETLIMETTYALPRYRFPPTEQVLRAMVDFCRDAIEENAVPVLFGYSLGKAQEILCALCEAGLVPMLHGAVFRMTEIYRELNPEFPCNYVRYDAATTAGKVLVCPPSANRSPMIQRIRERRTAILTGWAMNPGAQFRYQCDAAFPLSDHADYPDLIRYVELVKPQRVLTVHGYASDFARDLRERGIEAWALSEQNQLEFALPARRVFASAAPAPPEPETAPLGSEFLEFARLGDAIAATSSKLRKIALLESYLRSLNETALPIAATFLTGSAFPQRDQRKLQVGWAIIKRAILSVSHAGEQQFREAANTYSDAGRTALELLQGRTNPEPMTLLEAREFFTTLESTRGPIAKGELLERRLATITAKEGEYVIRILARELRIGLKEGLVEEAIAAAFDAPLDLVKEANMLLGDIGETARLASRQELATASLQLFQSIKCMLASPEPTAAAIWLRFGAAIDGAAGREFWVEDKFDGIRAQLHAGGDRVEIYSRDLKNITGQFPEIAAAARQLSEPAIFDGEIIAFDQGRRLTFFDLQKRLGRKQEADLFHQSDIPVQFVAFDLLWADGESLLRQPLRVRRARLDRFSLPSGIERIAIERVDSAAAIDAQFLAARRRGNEGLIVKDAASSYTPGRRGLAWLKLKKELATLDVVVVGAEYGHGKRANVLSDYTFAVRDDTSGALLTIGKAYSGLTDAEIAHLTGHFLANTTADHGRYREVAPDTVLEVAFDSIQPSQRHASGLALRFPRIKAIRTDKSPAEIDSLSYARQLAQECASA
jgi:DNA ligase-1